MASCSLGFLLADEFGEALRAELELDDVVVVDAAGGDEAFGVGALLFVCDVH